MFCLTTDQCVLFISGKDFQFIIIVIEFELSCLLNQISMSTLFFFGGGELSQHSGAARQVCNAYTLKDPTTKKTAKTGKAPAKTKKTSKLQQHLHRDGTVQSGVHGPDKGDRSLDREMLTKPRSQSPSWDSMTIIQLNVFTPPDACFSSTPEEGK